MAALLEQVVLLHGLYTSPCIMRSIGRRLAAQGFAVHYFAYRSTRQRVSHHAERLAQCVAALRSGSHPPLHLLGHSLGGLVVRQFAASWPELLNGRCLTLGTPHQGSVVAHRLYRRAPCLLGAAYHHGLDGQLPPWPQNGEWGSIAGNANIGIGRLLAADINSAGGDGTVAIEETKPANCRHHLVLPVSHTAMLFNRRVAHQAGHFLRYGCFDVTRSIRLLQPKPLA